MLKINNSLVLDQELISECLAESFESISSSNNYSKTFLSFKNISEQNKLLIPADNFESYNSPILFNELSDSLSDCKGSSPGPDNIHYDMILNLSLSGKKFLLNLFNQIWLNHVFPDDWRRAILIAVLKPGKDPRLPNNYRPISLTNCLCKILERIINKRLIWTLENQNFFHKYQSGFRKFRSSIDNLLFLEHHIMKTFCEKKYLVSIFFDIEKAYDTTWRYFIVSELLKTGLKGNIVFFIENFLKERHFNLLNGNHLSSSKKMENGIVQGSILSVSLFLVAINSIFRVVQFPVKSVIFADDLAIFISGKDFEEIKIHLQNTLNSLNNWSNETGLKFSQSKTVAMCFTRKYKVSPFPDLFLNGTKIEFVESYKFLGMTLDPKLKWVHHLKQIKSKASQNLNLLKMLSNHNFGSDRKLMLRLHQTMILSVIDYGSQLYSSANLSTLKILDPIHNSGIRFSIGAFKTSPINSIVLDSGLLPLHLRRDKQCLNYAMKILSFTNHSLNKFLLDNSQLEIFHNRNLNYKPFSKRSIELFNKYNINIQIKFDSQKFHEKPPWLCNDFLIDTSLSDCKKENTSTLVFKKKFYNAISKYPEFSKIYTDGSLFENKTSCAVKMKRLEFKYRLLDYSSIFSAELFAILQAIYLANFQKNKKFLICSDSLSSLQSLKKIYTKHPFVMKIRDSIQNKVNNNSFAFLWIPSHCGIKNNEYVDQLAKEALNDIVYENYAFFSNDMKFLINKNIWNEYNNQWISIDASLNKLKFIKTSVSPWKNLDSLSRKQTIILTRLRIGHSRLTHKHLFDKVPPDFCDCGENISIKHIFTNCPLYRELREKNEIKDINILAKNDINSMNHVLKFIQEANLYNSI